MSDLLIRAQPPLEFIPPDFNPLVLKGSKAILPIWLSWKTNIAQIQGEGVETLAQLYQQFQSGKIRFLMGFRHPGVNDPWCMAQLVWKILPKIAKEQGIKLQNPTHAHFIYDRGIPLWAGQGVGWLYSHLGGTSIQRGKADLMGLRSIRHLFANGKFPLAAAPEGATNGHNEIVSPLEPGIAQFCFWCLDDLRKAQRTETVFLVPIGIQYRYVTPPWQAIETLLTELEKDCGLTAATTPSNSLDQTQLYQRLYGLGEHLLEVMEAFYREFYHRELPKISEEEITDTNQRLATRLHNLLNVALEVAETYFGLPNTGNVVDRCRRVEQAGWEYIYREDLKPDNPLTPVKLGLADRVAEEASLRMWHMRIVESFVAVTGSYVKEKTTGDRFAETTLLLWDFIARIKGNNSFFRPQLGQQNVQITVGKPISVSERWDDYKKKRRQAVSQLTQDLQTALEGLIISA
jgi:hypothetical protein